MHRHARTFGAQASVIAAGCDAPGDGRLANSHVMSAADARSGRIMRT